MSQVTLNQDMLVHLPAADQVLLRSLLKVLEDGGAPAKKLEVLVEKIMRAHSSVDWAKMSPDIRLQACADYLVIGLMTGEVKRKDLEKLAS